MVKVDGVEKHYHASALRLNTSQNVSDPQTEVLWPSVESNGNERVSDRDDAIRLQEYDGNRSEREESMERENSSDSSDVIIMDKKDYIHSKSNDKSGGDNSKGGEREVVFDKHSIEDSIEMPGMRINERESESMELRRSGRLRKAPDRLNL